MHFKNKLKNNTLQLISLCLLNLIGVSGDRGSSIGCYRQNRNFHRLDLFAGSSEVCVDACEHSYFRYAVLDGSACMCTNSINEKVLNNEECDRPCAENHQQICGGNNAQSYYDTDLKVAGPPQYLRTTNRTESSILLQWKAPLQQQLKSFDQYIVRAKILKKFGIQTLLPLPQWIVEKNEDGGKIDIVNLYPGTTYNISVTSNSVDYGEGGTSSIVAETEIGIPDPEPEQPVVLSRDGTTLTIQIPHLINNNGPVTLVHVVVLFVDSELLQTFDEHLLKNYNQAQEDGTNYYIAAEIINENKTRNFTIGDGRNYGEYVNAPLPPDRHVHASLGIVSKLGSITKTRYAVVTSHEQHDKNANSLPKTIIFHTEDVIDDSNMVTWLIIACCFFGFLLVLSIVGYFYLRITVQNRAQSLSSDHHELSLRGPIIEVENNGGYQPDEFAKRSFEQKLNDLLDQLEPSKKHARNALTLDVNHVIANGQFGDMIRGKINNEPCQAYVISDDMEPLDQSQFLKDFAILQNIRNHKNLIDFYGICQTADWLYLLFEDTSITLKNKLIESRTPPNVNPSNFSAISEVFVLQMMLDLSLAMEFLAKQQFVHRKLCSHNISFTGDETVKISCFAATPFDKQRNVIDLSRWSAPEVLRFQHYSERSDVWSFGCLMWECCSLGGTLYANINSSDLIGRIKSGSRPERIPYVFDDMYQLMLNCWQLEPSDRPSFPEISYALRQFLTAPNHVMSFMRRHDYLLPYYLPLLEVQHT